MNQKGFSLIELVATIVILGIVASITIFAVGGGFSKTKAKTEDVFIKTIEDSLNIFTDSSDAKSLTFSTEKCTIQKRYDESKIYRSSKTLKFNDILNSEFTPLTELEFVNPANEDATCDLNAPVYIYRDEEQVYYYLIAKSKLGCLSAKGYITNLPCDCLKNMPTISTQYLPDRCKGEG